MGGCYRLKSHSHLLALALLGQESRQSHAQYVWESAHLGHKGTGARNSDYHLRKAEDVGHFSETPFSLAQQHLITQDMGHSHKVRWVFVISTQKKWPGEAE